ncbi:MAG: Na+/alanine symporter [Crocinitomicaceae bacterium]|jgi:Na+/alanine symporter
MKFLLGAFAVLLPFFQFAKEKGIDEIIDNKFGDATGWFVKAIFYKIPFTESIQVPWVLIVLVVGALFFTIYFKFINITGFKTAIRIVRGKYDEIETGGADHVEASESVHTVDGDVIDTIRVEQDSEHIGEVSHFQALTAALSATVGLGNIAGVAVAISIGGPGATFWMIIAGMIGMASKFAECTLGVKYREIDENGTVYGGPMYYLSKGLRDRGLVKIGRVLAIVFAIMCIGGSFGGGNMFQSNQAFAMLESYTQDDITDDAKLEAAKDAQILYDYHVATDYKVLDVKKDSIRVVSTVDKKKVTEAFLKETLLEDSVMILNGAAKLTKADLNESLIGDKIAYVRPETYLGDIKAITADSVTLNDGQANMTVAKAGFIGNSKTTPLSGNGWIFGLIMAVFVGIVIIGGIKKIARVTDKIVPFMVGIYVVAALIILGMHFSEIPNAFGQIFSGAFTGLGIAGGTFGVLIQGFQRAAFSNEAGIGSASIAHSAVKTKYAASEGLVALLEPFIDTVLVCTMTALVLIISNGDGSIMTYGQGVNEGVEVTSRAFASNISWFPIVLTIAVVLFAFSTMISWSYYGYQAWSYLFGRSKRTEYTYKALFCIFVIVGAAVKLGSVLDFSDAMIFAMLVPNMIGLFLLAPRVKEELARFRTAIKEKVG